MLRATDRRRRAVDLERPLRVVEAVAEPVVHLELDPGGGEHVQRRRGLELLARHQLAADRARVRRRAAAPRARDVTRRAGRCARSGSRARPSAGRRGRCRCRRACARSDGARARSRRRAAGRAGRGRSRRGCARAGGRGCRRASACRAEPAAAASRCGRRSPASASCRAGKEAIAPRPCPPMSEASTGPSCRCPRRAGGRVVPMWIENLRRSKRVPRPESTAGYASASMHLHLAPFLALKLAGVAYLVWMWIQVRRALPSASGSRSSGVSGARPRPQAGRGRPPADLPRLRRDDGHRSRRGRRLALPVPGVRLLGRPLRLELPR